MHKYDFFEYDFSMILDIGLLMNLRMKQLMDKMICRIHDCADKVCPYDSEYDFTDAWSMFRV